MIVWRTWKTCVDSFPVESSIGGWEVCPFCLCYDPSLEKNLKHKGSKNKETRSSKWPKTAHVIHDLPDLCLLSGQEVSWHRTFNFTCLTQAMCWALSRLPFHGSWMGDSLRAVNWGTSKSLLTCVFSFRDHPPSFSDVLSLESYCFICVASFSLVSGRRIKSGTQLSDWTITDG